MHDGLGASRVTDRQECPRPHRQLVAGFCGLGAVLALFAVAFCLYASGLFLPSWTQWSEAELEAHFAAGEASSQVVLAHRRVCVIGDSDRVVYETPRGWKVFDVGCADLDQDGDDELILALWKRGKQGSSRALWERDLWTRWHPWFAQHLYVLTYKDGAFAPFWMGGDLDAHVASMYVDDDAHVHLVTPEDKDSSWMWEGWGFAASD